jgi:hypothetical protein
MIDLVTSIRDISDSLPALSSGVAGAVVDNEPDLAIFAADVPEAQRQPRSRVTVARRRSRPWMRGYNPAFDPMRGYDPLMGMGIVPQMPRVVPHHMMPGAYILPDASSSDYDAPYFHNPYDSDDSDSSSGSSP